MTDDGYQYLGSGITCIDTGLIKPGVAACYILEHGGEAAIIETGNNQTVSRILAVLDQLGLSREQVRYVIPTHVHLDHAGGAGTLMKKLPQARLIVHPRGAQHMIDPEKLEAGVRAIYGDEKFDELYGRIEPVPSERIVEAGDGFNVDLAGRQLEMRDTPGHANHHLCVWDDQSMGWFTGDTFGMSYREQEFPGGRYIFPSSTPVQFDPELLLDSVKLLLSSHPERMYLTHYGMVENVQTLARSLCRQIRDYRDMALELIEADNRLMRIRQRITEYSLTEMKRLNPQLDEEFMSEIIGMDMQLNAQGLDVWLNRVER